MAGKLGREYRRRREGKGAELTLFAQRTLDSNVVVFVDEL
jgi:hypothetical protein